MDKLEMIEKLQQKADISMAEAKQLLENCNWVLLDALIELEKQGRLRSAMSHAASGAAETPVSALVVADFGANAKEEKNQKSNAESGRCCGKNRGRFKDFVKKVYAKGMANHLMVEKNGETVADIPVFYAALLCIFFFWLIIILMVVGIFAGCSYRFRGEDLGKENISETMRKANETAQDLAGQVKEKVQAKRAAKNGDNGQNAQ